MKCPYCGVNELGTGDINGKCCACENKFNNSGYPLLGEVREYITCPFCGESEFDLIGLKSHFENGDCEKYNSTKSIVRMFK